VKPRILIVAYGNPLRSDDSFAWHAANLLRGKWSADDVDLICAHQLTPDLAERISHAESVLFLDARANGNPGHISCTLVPPHTDSPACSHMLSPSQLMELSRQLYGATPEGYVLSVTGESFIHGEELSQKVKNAMPQAVETVDRLIRDILQRPIETLPCGAGRGWT